MTAEAFQNDGLILRRMQRGDEAAWQNARSWLGGRPRMDPARWPRSSYNNVPLHHLAQIDFADLPSGPWTAHLPASGALSFFLDTQIEEDELISAVVYMPNPQAYPPVDPPSDCPPVSGEMWFYEDLHRSAASKKTARRVMLQWLVEFVPAQFKAEPENYTTKITPSLDKILGPPVPDVHIFKDKRYEDREGGFKPVDDASFPWDAVRRLVQNVAQAVPDVAFIKTWRAELAGKDLYAPIGADVAERIEADVREVRAQTGARIRYGSGTGYLRDAASEAYREMMVGPRAGYDKIPQPLRQYLETDRRRPAYGDDSRHQMFGVGRNVQGQVDERADEVLLFQADTDEMMLWMWGDVGVLQFWITPEALITKSWDAVEATFESG